jgi:hypothetical protein
VCDKGKPGWSSQRCSHEIPGAPKESWHDKEKVPAEKNKNAADIQKKTIAEQLVKTPNNKKHAPSAAKKGDLQTPRSSSSSATE